MLVNKFMPSNKKKTPPTWKSHENHVGVIYRLLGYKVTYNINIDGQQTDLLCEKVISGAGKVVLYVDCKYTEDEEQNSISKDEVNQFIANFHSMKSKNGWTAGIMVSNKEFTQFAQAAAAPHSDIFLKTVDDLYSDLFQIHSYLHSCINTYEADGFLDDYIPLYAKYIIDTSNRSAKKNLRKIFEDWLGLSNAPQLCILGDFGAGKTTSARKLHYEYAKRFLNNDFDRMPLYIQLKDFYDVRDAQDLMEKFFSTELAAKVPYKYFEEFSQRGRFLLFLDGFDEMGAVSDMAIRKRNYFKLSQLISPKAKMVITCRPAYFVSNEELFEVFRYYKQQIGKVSLMSRGDKKRTQVFIDLSDTLKAASQETRWDNLLTANNLSNKDTDIASLQLFDEPQIKSYLKIHREDIIKASDGQINDSRLFSRIQKIYDLEDLAKRPILLKLIVRTLPRFKKDSEGKYLVSTAGNVLNFTDITPSVLYYVYTEGELTREYDKGEARWQIEREERRAIIARLAYQMFQTETLTLDSETISSVVGLHFQSEGERLAQLVTDVRTCSFLTVDRYNFLRFAHKSFMEYYTAWHLVDLMHHKRQAMDVLAQRMFSKEILYFAGDLIGSFFPACIGILNQVVASQTTEITLYNALNLLNNSRNPHTYLNRVEIEGLFYVKLSIRNITFSKCVLSQLHFTKCKVGKLILENTSVAGVKFEGGNLNRISVTSCSLGSWECLNTKVTGNILADTCISSMSLNRAVISMLTITNSSLAPESFEDSTIHNTRFTKTLIAGSDDSPFHNCQMEDVTFENCIFFNLDCGDGFLAKGIFKNCIFIRCYLDDERLLDRLRGSHGFFLSRHGNDAEMSGRPCLWTPKRAEIPVANFRRITSTSEKEERQSRFEFLQRQKWEDVLAIAFPKSLSLRLTDKTHLEIRNRIKRTKDELMSLC